MSNSGRGGESLEMKSMDQRVIVPNSPPPDQDQSSWFRRNKILILCLGGLIILAAVGGAIALAFLIPKSEVEDNAAKTQDSFVSKGPTNTGGNKTSTPRVLDDDIKVPFPIVLPYGQDGKWRDPEETENIGWENVTTIIPFPDNIGWENVTEPEQVTEKGWFE